MGSTSPCARKAAVATALAAFDSVALLAMAACLWVGLSCPALAYVDPSVMTYTIQALAGVAVALSAVIGVAWRRLRRVVLRVLKVDENAGKTVETHVSRVVDASPDLPTSKPTTLMAPKGGAYDGAPLTWPKRFGIALVAMALFMFTNFVAAPYEIVGANGDSLLFNLHDVWIVMLAFAFLAGTAVALLLSALRGRAFDVAVAIVFALGAASLAQALFMNGGLPTADGKAVDWGGFAGSTATSLVVWAALVAAAIVFVVKVPSLGRLGLCSLAVVLMLVQGVGVARYVKRAITQPAEYMVSKQGLFEVSDKSNVIVFIVDTVDTQEFDTVLADYPDTLDSFTGFTYFRNSVGSMIPTAYGVPFLTTGQMLNAGDDYASYVDGRWEKGSFISDVANDANYSVSLYADCLYTGKSLYGDMTDNIHPAADKGVDVWATIGILSKVSLYRNAPWAAKSAFWYYTDDMNQAVLGIGSGETSDYDTPYVIDDGAYYDELKSRGLSVSDEQDKAGALKVIHLNGSHVPFVYDENMDVPEGGSTMEQQTRGVFRIVEQYLDDLKELGVYDDSTIIITADHGYWGSTLHGESAPTTDDLNHPISPVCLVKPAGARGEYQVSEAPVSHADFQPTVLKAMGDEADAASFGDGTSYFDVSDTAQRLRYFVMERYDGVHETTMDQYVVDGDALDFSNWSYTGVSWGQGDH